MGYENDIIALDKERAEEERMFALGDVASEIHEAAKKLEHLADKWGWESKSCEHHSDVVGDCAHSDNTSSNVTSCNTEDCPLRKEKKKVRFDFEWRTGCVECRAVVTRYEWNADSDIMDMAGPDKSEKFEICVTQASVVKTRIPPAYIPKMSEAENDMVSEIARAYFDGRQNRPLTFFWKP